MAHQIIPGQDGAPVQKPTRVRAAKRPAVPTIAKASVISLVPPHVSEDTISCLHALLRRAHRGEVIGLAYCAMLRGRAYIVDTAGAAHDSPTFARGMVAALDDSLSARIGA